ncbi:hypothetical protein Pelo_18558 [Pelomyxa schiedti]|nr:hypothetical protein Pelo_18558 [Pelomyxa schiedti]
MTVAEALFPLVAKACAVVLETRDDRVGVDEGAKDFWATCQVKYRSSYFAVECAAIAGVQKGDGGGGLGTARCLRWVLEHRKSRNIKKESLAVLWGLCSSNNLLAAQQLVLNPGQSLHAGTAASCWAWDDEVRDSLRWDYNSNVPSTLLSCVCRAGHLDVAKWMVPRFGFQKWDLWGPFLAALKGGHVEVAKLLREQVYWEFMTRNDRREAQLRAADSGCIDAIDWCWPMVEVHDYFPSEAILRGLLNSPKTSEDKIEGCKYLVKQFSEQYHQPTWARLVIKEEMTLRHLIRNL